MKKYFPLWAFLIWVLTFPPLQVSAATTDIGYTTNNTSVIISNNRGGDVNLAVNHTNTSSVLADINAVLISVTNQNFLANTIYQLEIGTPDAKFDTNINSFVVSGYNTSCRYYGMANIDTSYPSIYFSCPANTSYILVSLNTIAGNQNITTGSNFRWSYTFLRKLDDSSDMDFGPVITNQTQNTENIINNDNNNTQQIIDNQNSLLGTKCSNQWNPTLKTVTTHRGITFTPVLRDGVVEKYIVNGTRTSAQNAYVTMMNNFTLNKGTHIKVYSNADIYLQLYDGTNVINTKNYTAAETKTWSQVSIFTSQSPIDNAEFKVMITSEDDTTFCIYDTYISKLDNTTNAINGVTNALTDDSPISLDSISDTAGWLPAGPIDSIINLPLNFFNNLLNALNKTCQPINIPLPYVNRDLPIPCISTIFNQIDGLPNFWSWVGVITSVVILYRYLIALYKYYDDLTTLKANFISDFGGAP